MTTLAVLAPGFSSLQDLGRFGLQRFGIATAGAMDRGALVVANRLLGNEPGEAAVEIGPGPAQFAAAGPLRFAVTGAERPVTVGGRKVGMYRTAIAEQGDTVEVGSARGGMFSYLGLEGGPAVDAQYASRSVDPRAGFGWPAARPLQAGDELPVRAAGRWPNERECRPPLLDDGPVRVILGPQDDYFFPETIERFLSTQWRVGVASNRMSYSLEGPPLAHARGYNIISDATVTGAIQIAGHGQPYVLLADRGTVGGYPKIAVVATADLDRFAQLPPGAAVHFRAVGLEEARAALVARRRSIAAVTIVAADNGRAPVDAAALWSSNLAGCAVDALSV